MLQGERGVSWTEEETYLWRRILSQTGETSILPPRASYSSLWINKYSIYGRRGGDSGGKAPGGRKETRGEGRNNQMGRWQQSESKEGSCVNLHWVEEAWLVLTSTENTLESPKSGPGKKEKVGNKTVSKAFSSQSLNWKIWLQLHLWIGTKIIDKPCEAKNESYKRASDLIR